MVDADTSSGDTFNKKIRNAQLAQYNYILGRRHCHVICWWACMQHASDGPACDILVTGLWA